MLHSRLLCVEVGEIPELFEQSLGLKVALLLKTSNYHYVSF